MGYDKPIDLKLSDPESDKTKSVQHTMQIVAYEYVKSEQVFCIQLARSTYFVEHPLNRPVS